MGCQHHAPAALPPGSRPGTLCRLRLKCDGTRAETRFRLSAKRTSPFQSAGASVQSTIGSRGVRISGCNAGYTMFRGSVKSTGYPLHSPVSLSLPLPCVTVCHHVSTGLYMRLGGTQSRSGRVRNISPPTKASFHRMSKSEYQFYSEHKQIACLPSFLLLFALFVTDKSLSLNCTNSHFFPS